MLIQVGGAGACDSDLHLMHDFDARTRPAPPVDGCGQRPAYPLGEAVDVYRRLAGGEINGRAVVVPAASYTG